MESETPIERRHSSGEFRNTNIFQSFSHAFEGLTHVLWTQKHVRTQLFMVALVFILSFYLRLKTLDFLFIMSAIAFVLVAELFNTAVEVVVNMITREYHPLAKIAKDVAAAAVLISSFYALIVGGAVFFRSDLLQTVFTNSHLVIEVTKKPNPIVVIFLCFAVLSIFVMLGKSKKTHGSILQGGAVSGHTAVAFMLATTIALQSAFDIGTTVIAFLLAVLVAQSRVEGKIHSLAEVLWGALFAVVLMVLIVLLS